MASRRMLRSTAAMRCSSQFLACYLRRASASSRCSSVPRMSGSANRRTAASSVVVGRVQVVLKQKLHGALPRLTSLAHSPTMPQKGSVRNENFLAGNTTEIVGLTESETEGDRYDFGIGFAPCQGRAPVGQTLPKLGAERRMMSWQ